MNSTVIITFTHAYTDTLRYSSSPPTQKRINIKNPKILYYVLYRQHHPNYYVSSLEQTSALIFYDAPIVSGFNSLWYVKLSI